MTDDVPQHFDQQPTSPKDRSAGMLLALLIIGAVMVVGGAVIALKAIQKLPLPAPGVPPVGNVNTGRAGITVPTAIKKFNSYQELTDFLAEHSGGDGYRYDRMAPMSSLGMPVQELRNVGPSTGGMGLDGTVNEGLSYSTVVGWGTQGSWAGNDYSNTNIQVAGVDEADIIKTDGRYIYAVSGQNLFIIEAYPPDRAAVISKIEFKSQPQDLFINGNSLVVFGLNTAMQSSDTYKKFKRRSAYTFFKVFDVSDHKNPRQIRDLDFEGQHTNARMIGDYVYLVTANSAGYIDGEPPIPRLLENNLELPIERGSPRCNCPDVYYFDPDEDSYSATTVAAINVQKAAEPVTSDVYLLTAGQTLYVSADHLYITYTKRVDPEVLTWEALRDSVLPRLSDRDRERIAKIEAIDSNILSRAEKFRKINAIIERWAESLGDDEQRRIEKELEGTLQERWKVIAQQLEQTIIHKIAISGRDLNYVTFGAVPGLVLNQFSLDEHDGYLRIATTRSRQWNRWGEFNRSSQDSYSNLYVLDKNLKVAGKVEELAPGEQIYSVRFMQDRGYLVTFRQTDPLFAIDLSDPRNPRQLGKLKVPGFSDYLHPYDNATLIGLGQEDNKLKLSLFDVADVSAPREIAKYIFDDYGSDSIARKQHKAFLFSKEKNLLVIPIALGGGGGVDVISCPPCLPGNPCPQCEPPILYQPFTGAAVFSVDKTGFTLRGKIRHEGVSQVEPMQGGYKRQTYYPRPIKRSLYIKDVLYTFSDQYLKANHLGTLGELKYLELKKEARDDFEIIN